MAKKNKLLTIMMVVVMVVGLLPLGAVASPHPFEGGDGSQTNPYQVKTAEQLNQVRNYLDSNFVQTGNINLDDFNNWEPIDNFSGTYDGNVYKITNLLINRPSSDYQGLFGRVSGAVLKNISLEGIDVLGKNYVGGLVGYNHLSTVMDSYAAGSVSGNDNVGGLVGYNEAINFQNRSTVINSYVSGSVTGNINVGGLVGYNFQHGSEIINSYASGSVTGNTNIGGLVGENDWYGTITNSYATGNVTGDFRVGGLVGNNYRYSSVTNSYATCSVSGNTRVGGLVGTNWWSSAVSNSYATGSVSGNDNVGGLVGRNEYGCTVGNSYASGSVTGDAAVGGLVGNNSGTVTNSYYDSQTTGQSDNTEKGIPRTTADMTYPYNDDNTYEEWDFTDTWDIQAGYNDGYPFLEWQGAPPPDNVTITYVAGAGGSVNPTSETLDPVTGEAEGSTATADPGYAFVNWTDAAGTIVDTDPHFVPQKVGNLNVAATYYANFELAVSDPGKGKPDSPPGKPEDPGKPDSPPGKPEDPGKPVMPKPKK